MKKQLILLSIVFAILIMTPQVNKKLSTTEQPVNHAITLFVYKNNNYSSAAYDSTIASVRIRVCKVVGRKSTPVFEKTLNTMQLNQFPDAHNALSSKLVVSNILNSREKLLIYYDVVYDTRGSQLTVSNYRYAAAAGENSLTIHI